MHILARNQTAVWFSTRALGDETGDRSHRTETIGGERPAASPGQNMGRVGKFTVSFWRMMC